MPPEKKMLETVLGIRKLKKCNGLFPYLVNLVLYW